MREDGDQPRLDAGVEVLVFTTDNARRLGGIAIVVATGALALADSWKRWLDPIIDTGRDLYIPEQLLNGAKLYRDIRYQYPPLAPYLLAAVTKLTGHSLAAYAAIGIVVSAIITALLWYIGERLAGMAAGFAAALLFVAINFTGASTFGANFVSPYTYAATIGMALLLGFFAAVLDLPHRHRAIAVVLALAASWCKVEYAIAVIVVLIALAASRTIRWRDLSLYAAGGGLTGAMAILYFGAGPLRDNIFAVSLTEGGVATRFFSVVAGTADWSGMVIQAVIGLAAVIGVEFLRRRDRRIGALAAITAAVVLPVNALFRGAGLLQWLALARPRDRWMFLLAALSVASTMRVALNVAPIWYGFVLIVPLYLLIAYATRGDAIWLLAIAVLCVRNLDDQRLRWSAKEFPIVTSRGTLFDANSDRAEILNAAIPRLRAGTAAVFPEGISLDYFAGVTTPLTFHTFTPAETKDAAVEDRVIAEMNARAPDRVVILSRDVREYGSRGFGVDYDQRLVALIRSRYAVESAWMKPRFSLVILRRR